jgi:hypothetical protein
VKRVVAHGARSFGDKTAIAIRAMQAIANLDLAGEFGGMMKKPAVAEQRALGA